MEALRSFMSDRLGGVAVIVGLGLPVLIGATGAVVEYGSLVRRKAELQKAADMAAVSAGKELTLANASDDQVISVVKVVATSALTPAARTGSLAKVDGQVLQKRTAVAVTITETVPSFFGQLLTQPTSTIGVKAVARLSGKTRLCLLGLDPASPGAINLERYAKVTGNGCLLQANSTSSQSIKALDYSIAKADRICTAGGYSGKAGTNFMPTPVTDCPVINDPLADRPPPSVGRCDHNKLVLKDGSHTLQPGVYCGGLTITGGAGRSGPGEDGGERDHDEGHVRKERKGTSAKVRLAPGTYIIKDGPLTVNKQASLEGDYVGFYLSGKNATFTFAFDSTVNLSAPKTGSMAGILFFEDRSATGLRRFTISSDNARNLLGTFYLPKGILSIDANKPVADQSAYTVIVARQVHLSAGPDVVLNTNYGATDVPVPKGVGPLAGVALVH